MDSWDRNNTILVNLLRALPDTALEVRPMASSPSIGALFAHIRYVRLIFVAEDAPEHGRPLPDGEWRSERDRDRIANWLQQSADAVRERIDGMTISFNIGRVQQASE